MRIHILSPGLNNPNSVAFLFPFFAFRSVLVRSGIKTRVFYTLHKNLTDCDLLLIEAKSLTVDWDEKKSLEILSALSQKTRIIWCDQSDSTGTFLGQVLPFVQAYLKAQVLNDTALYKQSFYGDRLYTDYYHKAFGIEDSVDYHYEPAKTDADLSKIKLSWNSGLMNYGLLRPYLMKLWSKVNKPVFMSFSKRYTMPSTQRTHDVGCRMGLSYPRATIRFQREKMSQILAAHIPTNKLSHGAYLQELRDTTICVSPFGYGEITLKDFEAFLSGCALFKPDMSHMRTWPDFYQSGTYIAHKWDLSDVLTRLEAALHNREETLETARNGQRIYRQHTSDPQAGLLFLEQLKQSLDIGSALR